MKPRDLFIAAFVVLQAVLPLHYYLLRDSPYDERFSWRMFSDVRMLRCNPSYTVDRRGVNLERYLHTAWITLLKRGRPDVIEHATAELCEKVPGELKLRMDCTEADGETYTLIAVDEDICSADWAAPGRR